MTKDDLQNPEHWRARAEETRAKAAAMGSPEFRERMLQIALEYDGLAEWVERESAKAPLAIKRGSADGTSAPVTTVIRA